MPLNKNRTGIPFLLMLVVLWPCNPLNGQTMTMEEVSTSLMANPPVYGDSATRRACFKTLDVKFKEEDAPTSTEVKAFWSRMIKNIAADITTPATGLAVVYKMYNHGFIVKMQDLVIAFDLINGMPSWNPIPDEILRHIDVALLTHDHGDHYDPNVLTKIRDFGGEVIIPEEMNFTGAIGLAPGDSVIINDVVFKAYYALHGDWPCRIYEVYSPLGIKIMHTGDNQTSVTLPDVDGIDILLLNSWVNEGDGNFSNVIGMYNCLQKLTPEVMIPGHCNELSHVPSQRWAYDSVYALMELNIPSDVVVMAWGEKFIYEPNSFYPVHKTSTPPTIDGYWDPAWAFTPVVNLSKQLLTAPDDWLDLYGNIRTMWNDDNMYFFFHVQDDILRTDNPDMWNNDVIELFFDGDNSKNDGVTGYDENDTQMRFEYMGGSWQVPNSEYAYQQTNRGYNLEIRIPSEDLKFEPETDKIIGFDAQVTDNDNGTANSIIRWWSESLDNWFNASLFGTAKLTGPALSGIKEVYYTPSAIQVDAELDNAWVGRELNNPNHVVLGEEFIDSPGDINLFWNVLWDVNYLYFWFDIRDDIFINDSGEDYYDDDCVEIWLDGDNSKGNSHDGINDFCFQFRYQSGTIIAPVKQPIGPAVNVNDIEQAAKLTPEGIILEVAIPLEMLQIEPYDNVVFGFDLDYDDDDDYGIMDSKLKTYGQYDASWETPADWGTAILCGSGRVKEIPSSADQPVNLNDHIHIYPNPFRDQLTIEFYIAEKVKDVSVAICDISGRKIYSGLYIPGPDNTFILSEGISNLESGTYLVKIDAGNIVYTEKVVKY